MSPKVKTTSNTNMAARRQLPVRREAISSSALSATNKILHDSHTLPAILKHVEASRGKAAKRAVCDRGYRGKNEDKGSEDKGSNRFINYIFATFHISSMNKLYEQHFVGTSAKPKRL